ncbi:lipoprotein insertase outer membrane protein LolB [Chitinimonas lacunae]|uniref:Outer-membrane lipoprotein LolB n=1 Tax=Chitinimonas lacunae TaxID=1963018 RepID=A0ABV8MTF0_9NEIS
MSPRHSLLVAAAALWLAACATLERPAPPPPSALPERYAVSGRIAVKAQGKGYSAHFGWRHDSTRDTVDVRNPLGQVVARLELGPDGARWTDADGLVRDADDIESLTERELGWRLPARGLRFWLLGLADPERPSQWGEDNGNRLLEQDGWRISFPPANSAAPNRLTLARPDLEVRIALYDWQLDSLP